jgi:hypothetical protein
MSVIDEPSFSSKKVGNAFLKKIATYSGTAPEKAPVEPDKEPVTPAKAAVATKGAKSLPMKKGKTTKVETSKKTGGVMGLAKSVTLAPPKMVVESVEPEIVQPVTKVELSKS